VLLQLCESVFVPHGAYSPPHSSIVVVEVLVLDVLELDVDVLDVSVVVLDEVNTQWQFTHENGGMQYSAGGSHCS
jgi:hypothetical protein